ncbi:MAG: hypothetical protein [Olavius algarvensis Gamma 1 endosymbiont]|nr:MAG: hypothetical protein [Olavius algarvensis Gamma 1 endosymbiont]
MAEPFGWIDQAFSRPDKERRRFSWPPKPSFRQGMPEPRRQGGQAHRTFQGRRYSPRSFEFFALPSLDDGRFRGPTQNDGVAANAEPVGRGEPVDRVKT